MYRVVKSSITNLYVETSKGIFVKKIITIMLYVVFVCIMAILFVSWEAEKDKQNRNGYTTEIQKNTHEIEQKCYKLCSHNISAVNYRKSAVSQMESVAKMRCSLGIRGNVTEPIWTYLGSLFFVITTTTTIGYGYPAPKTLEGKITTMGLYIIGVPLAVMALVDVVDLILMLEKKILTTLDNTFEKPRKRTRDGLIAFYNYFCCSKKYRIEPDKKKKDLLQSEDKSGEAQLPQKRKRKKRKKLKSRSSYEKNALSTSQFSPSKKRRKLSESCESYTMFPNEERNAQERNKEHEVKTADGEIDEIYTGTSREEIVSTSGYPKMFCDLNMYSNKHQAVKGRSDLQNPASLSAITDTSFTDASSSFPVISSWQRSGTKVEHANENNQNIANNNSENVNRLRNKEDEYRTQSKTHIAVPNIDDSMLQSEGKEPTLKTSILSDGWKLQRHNSGKHVQIDTESLRHQNLCSIRDSSARSSASHMGHVGHKSSCYNNGLFKSHSHTGQFDYCNESHMQLSDAPGSGKENAIYSIESTPIKNNKQHILYKGYIADQLKESDASINHRGTKIGKSKRRSKKSKSPLKCKSKKLHIESEDVLKKAILEVSTSPKLSLLFTTVNLVIYMILGTFMYRKTEEWDYLDSVYFILTSISTVGFGDILPETSINFLFLSSLYILLGLALLAKIVGDIRMRMRDLMNKTVQSLTESINVFTLAAKANEFKSKLTSKSFHNGPENTNSILPSISSSSDKKLPTYPKNKVAATSTDYSDININYGPTIPNAPRLPLHGVGSHSSSVCGFSNPSYLSGYSGYSHGHHMPMPKHPISTIPEMAAVDEMSQLTDSSFAELMVALRKVNEVEKQSSVVAVQTELSSPLAEKQSSVVAVQTEISSQNYSIKSLMSRNLETKTASSETTARSQTDDKSSKASRVPSLVSGKASRVPSLLSGKASRLPSVVNETCPSKEYKSDRCNNHTYADDNQSVNGVSLDEDRK